MLAPEMSTTRRCRASAHVRSNSAEASRSGERAPEDTIVPRPSYPPVEAVRRAFALLRIVNASGVATISQLHRATKIAKPTIVRMLETLMLDGYVDRDIFSGGYRVTSHVQSLSSGFKGTPLILEAARAWTLRLTRTVLWPAAIGILEGDHIAIKFTTAAISPWPQPVSSLNMRLDLTTSALGRCYLAFCSDSEREQLLQGATDELMPRYVTTMLRTVRKDGYAMRDGRVGPKGMQVVAMPIMSGGHAVACLCIGFYTRALSTSQVETLLGPMRETIANIEHDIGNLTSFSRSAG